MRRERCSRRENAIGTLAAVCAMSSVAAVAMVLTLALTRAPDDYGFCFLRELRFEKNICWDRKMMLEHLLRKIVCLYGQIPCGGEIETMTASCGSVV